MKASCLGWRGTAAFFAVGAVAATGGIRPLAAQQRRRVEALYTYDGRPLDFTPDGVWRVKARRVAQQRASLLRQGQFSTLNSAVAQAAWNGTALTGTLYVPTILVGFKDTNVGTLPDTAQYDSIFYTTTALQNPQRAYSVRKYYEELSHGLFSVQGKVYGWVQADSNQAYYLGQCGADPMSCDSGLVRLGRLLRGALGAVDGVVNFAAYDNDGGDNTPNSTDDDGVVDLVQFVIPVVGYECGGPGYNAHHFSLAGLTRSQYLTNDPSAKGGNVRVNNYQIVAGVGGTGCTNSTQIMAAGTSAHETGHGLGLPDLYDTNFQSEGVGEWSLMGSGNYASLNSPTHFDAWSLQQMGWVTLAPLTAAGTYRVGPVERSDSVFVIQPVGANPRGEYWLLENKQAVGSDTSNMEYHGATGSSIPKHGGLAVWHVDSVMMARWPAFNDVNSGPIHGLALVQADGLRQLESTSGNRGDAGDPYPGTSLNRTYSYGTNPRVAMNYDTTAFAGFALDSITQAPADSSMVFKLSFGGLTVVQAADTLAKVTVDGTRYGRFAQLLTPGTSHTISMDSAQVTSDGLTQYLWASWSNGKLRTDTIVANVSGNSITASVSARFRMRATASAGGTITSNPSGNLAAGIYVPKDATIAVQATPDSGKVFGGWTGDTTSTADSLLITAKHAYTLAASFQDKLVAAPPAPPGPVMGSGYSYQLQATGGVGTYSWQVSSGALPDGVTLSTAGLVAGVPSRTGTFSAEVRATSGAQTDSVALALTVTAPTLVAADVVSQILATRAPLTADELRYLDLLGNTNGTFDVGDFLAWVSTTGANSPAIAAAMEALGASGRGGGPPPPPRTVHRPGGKP
jgi:M6 family metalloprotease-like protein